MDGQELPKQTLDQIPQANANAKRIVGLVKEGGRITGYQLSDESFVSKPEAVSMAKQGQIAGVGIAHQGDTEYLKSIPNGSENDNLGNLPSVSPEALQSAPYRSDIRLPGYIPWPVHPSVPRRPSSDPEEYGHISPAVHHPAEENSPPHPPRSGPVPTDPVSLPSDALFFFSV